MGDWQRIALRETSTEHVAEFEPITKGPLFAIVALAPLGALAACCLIWRKITALARPR